MDDQAFDRLARTLSGLRGRASRRQAVRAAVGAALAGAGLATAEAAQARRNRWWWSGNWTCRYNGTPCNRNDQCCNGNCKGGYCGGRNGGSNCDNTFCPDGWRCCKVNGGAHYCTPVGYGTCCGGYSYPNDYQCCNGGGACGGGNSCYGSGKQCCGPNLARCGRTCCPTTGGFRCRNGECKLRTGYAAQTAEGPQEPFEPKETGILVADEGVS
jgi:hypothetical protein